MKEYGQRRGIDVIIPIYNAYEDLQLCVESIQKHVDFTLDRVLLINDCSPDERIRPYVDEIGRQEGFLVMHNEKNLGFSGSVNRGISYSDRDVILLNSDTIVTAGWIDKLVRCADSDESIGTVTPLSNSATICSIPIYCQDNPIPDGFSVDQYAALVERCSLRKYPEITVAVGFCMFIKREVIRQVGLFDGETYQRGYGEENDFCWLANELGYIHVMCDDTFVYHKGTISFPSEEKKKLIAAHEKILKERYPKLARANEVFCATDQNWLIRRNIALYAKADPTKKNLLYVLHLDFHEACKSRVGGTQFHVEDLMKALKAKYNVYVAGRDGAYLRFTLYTEQGERVESRFLIGDAKPFQMFHDRKLQELFSAILSAFRMDIVHVHHTHGMSLDIFHVAHKMGIPVTATLHDYFTICPTIKLLNKDGTVCRGQETDADCTACLWKQCGISPKHERYIHMWREEQQKALDICDVLFTPSEAAKEVVCAYYPELRDKIKAIEHGLNPIVATNIPENTLHYTDKIRSYFEKIPSLEKADNVLSGWIYLEGTDSSKNQLYVYITDSNGKTYVQKVPSLHRADVAGDRDDYLYSGFSFELPVDGFCPGMLKVQMVVESGGQRWTDGTVLRVMKRAKKKTRLNVAFIGGMSPEKGSKMACQLIERSPSDIGWYVIGGIGDRELDLLQRDNLTKTGWYERSQLADILQFYQIDLACILSPWAETFCYTISEAWMCGVPVIATDIGAMGERTRKMKGGWVVPPDASCEEILDVIRRLSRDGEEYLEVKKRVASLPIRTIGEMAKDYEDAYDSCMEGSHPHYPALTMEQKKMLLDGHLLESAGERVSGPGGDQELTARLQTLEDQLQTIQGSISYKFARLLSRMKFPFKQQIKRLLLKIYGKRKK